MTNKFLTAELKTQLESLTKPFLFEINDKLTRDKIKFKFNEFFEGLPIFDFLVVVDETNNTFDRITKNELWIDIAVQQTEVGEFIFIPIRIKEGEKWH